MCEADDEVQTKMDADVNHVIINSNTEVTVTEQDEDQRTTSKEDNAENTIELDSHCNLSQ